MRFIKMHGLGNDFVFVDCFREKAPADPAARAVELCAPHFGVGADGLVLIEPSARADACMRIFNHDGSLAEMCGNAIRCVGKYLYESGLARRDVLTVETGAGVLTLELRVVGEKVAAATVDMGAPEFTPARIPLDAPENRVRLEFEGRPLDFFCLSMGNPHAVTVDAFPEGEGLSRLGRFIETHPLFPRRVNAEFCAVESRTRARLRVWERGAGATLACGTGASASLVALASLGLVERRAEIVLPGGSLEIDWRADGHVYMTGPAALSFTGEWPD